MKVEAAAEPGEKGLSNGMKVGKGIQGLSPVGHLSSWTFQKAAIEMG